MPVGGLHSRRWKKLKEGQGVVYYTRDALDKERRHHVETMTCRGPGRRRDEAEEYAREMRVLENSVSSSSYDMYPPPSDEAEECAWEMRVPENSECFGIEHACQVEMVLEGPDGSELETCSRILLVQRLPLGSRPH